MATLRLLTLCAIVSTALAFVAMGPPSRHTAAATTRPTFTAWGSRGHTSSVKSLGAGRGLCMAMERTYIMAKPDAVQRGIISDIVGRFEKKGYKLVALKLVKPPRSLLEEHYESLKDKPFFPKLMEYMTSGPVVAMVWEGKNVVATGRTMLGATNPLESAPGTIRGDFSIEVGRNICHGSDTVENAEREIKLWFGEGTIDWASHSQDWIYE
ncbi:nucleoside diphosphate kinase [Nannochloropsis oceanica]